MNLNVGWTDSRKIISKNMGGTEMGRLQDKVALISGGSKNQGAAEARVFAAEGAKMIFGDIVDAEGQAIEAERLTSDIWT